MTIGTGIGSLLLLFCSALAAQTEPPQPRLPDKVSPIVLPPAIPLTTPPPTETGENHLTELRQLTFGGENAEAYWSPDGRELIFQSQRPPYACDQIFRIAADGSEKEPRRVSTGKGRTTCSYFLAGGDRVIYSSTDAAGPACPPVPDRSQGYVWPIYDSYEIWKARPEGGDRVRLTDNSFYDAEATVCFKDGSILFTSSRDGDLDLYRMDADGRNVRRLTDAPGYDGGAFYSPDCSRIVWRASRPAPGKELEDYRGLLARGLVRPGKLELWTARADGSEPRQITRLGAASFAPSFFPDGQRVIFSSNYGDPAGREFDLWAVDLDGSDLERITATPGFDGFPLFSPDGRHLAFSSNRNQAKPGETNVFVARWQGARKASIDPAETERYLGEVRWLADDAREGRGLGSPGLAASADWLAARFQEIGLEPGGEGGYFQRFEALYEVVEGPATAAVIDGQPVAAERLRPAGFSASGKAAGEVVAAGYGITAPELGVDHYRGVDARGKVVAVRRFVPPGKEFSEAETEKRYSDLRYKAFNAREHGAVALLVVDLPELPEGTPLPDEAALPKPELDQGTDAGLPVLLLSREAGKPLFERRPGGHRASLTVDLARRTTQAANVVGVLRAGAAGRLPGAVVVGAHYDHLGQGGRSSRDPDVRAPHNGADDNASGTAGILEAARRLAARRGELRRDVWFVAFSGEEEGTLGSSAFTRKPPAGLALAPSGGTGGLVAMLNLDMVGRLREDKLFVLGGESATEWKEIVEPACRRAGLACTVNGEGFGPSDHSPFYAAGLPVLHFFTGLHEDYHKPSDDIDKINAEGGVRVAALVADVAAGLTGRTETLTFHSAPLPLQTAGDFRSYGASLGTIPDYAGPPDGHPGVLLSGVREGGPADKAGMRRGDILVQLAGAPVRDIYDFTYILRRSKPGLQVQAVVMRDGQRVPLEVTLGESRLR